VFAVLGLQNNLTQQFVRTDAALISYYIDGGSVQPPDTTVPLTVFLNPSVQSGTGGGGEENQEGGLAGADESPFDSSLPPGFDGETCSRAYVSFPIVPAAVRTWVFFNRMSLPEPPFIMVATVQVTGTSSAGDRYTTNEAVYNIYFTPDVVIPPSVGEDESEAAALVDESGLYDETDIPGVY